MKTVYVVMCKENDGIPSEDWISSIFETQEKAWQYIGECKLEDERDEFYWFVQQWEVK